MKELIVMIIVAWTPQPDGTLKEAWRMESQVPLEHCLIMNHVAGTGGKYGVIIVQCGELH